MFINHAKAHRIFNEVCEMCNVTRPRFTHYMQYNLSRTSPSLVRMYKEGEQEILNGVESGKADFTMRFQKEAQEEWDKVKSIIYGK
jgi:hypothetical protein